MQADDMDMENVRLIAAERKQLKPSPGAVGSPAYPTIFPGVGVVTLFRRAGIPGGIEPAYGAGQPGLLTPSIAPATAPSITPLSIEALAGYDPSSALTPCQGLVQWPTAPHSEPVRTGDPFSMVGDHRSDHERMIGQAADEQLALFPSGHRR